MTASKTSNAIIDRRVLVFFVGRGMVVDFDELIILLNSCITLLPRLLHKERGRVAGAIHGENFLVPLHVERTWLYGLPKGDE